MSYLNKVISVTQWEYARFYKLKNELIGIAVMAIAFTAGYFFSQYAISDLAKKQTIGLYGIASPELEELLSMDFYVERISATDSLNYAKTIKDEKEGLLLSVDGDNFRLLAYRYNKKIEMLQEGLNEYRKQQALTQKGITIEQYNYVTEPAKVEAEFVFQPGRGRNPIIACLLYTSPSPRDA